MAIVLGHEKNPLSMTHPPFQLTGSLPKDLQGKQSENYWVMNHCYFNGLVKHFHQNSWDFSMKYMCPG